MLVNNAGVCLLYLHNTCVAIPQSDVCNIAQSLSIQKGDSNDLSIGRYVFSDRPFSVYQLTDGLAVMDGAKPEGERGEFCVALNGDLEFENGLALTCFKVESVDLSKVEVNTQKIPSFMCSNNMAIDSLFTLEGRLIYSTTAAILSKFIDAQFGKASGYA